MTTPERDALVKLWSEQDQKHAILAVDGEAIRASASLRALIVDLAQSHVPDEELFDACALLGRLIARLRGSPTLASLTMDNACEALGARDSRWMQAARAAVFEGFAAELLDLTHREALGAWEAPSCVVLVPDGTLAVAAGIPSDDEDVVQGWAARVAQYAVAQGVRRASVAGSEAARRAVTDALRVVGIEVTSP
jgi:hypothetical protein